MGDDTVRIVRIEKQQEPLVLCYLCPLLFSPQLLSFPLLHPLFLSPHHPPPYPSLFSPSFLLPCIYIAILPLSSTPPSSPGQGATVKAIKNGKIVISRVLHRGAADKSGE